MLKKTIFVSIYFLISIFIINCSAKGSKFTSFKKPPKTKSMLYIYRPNSMIGYLVSYEIKDANNETIGILKNNSYIQKEVVPGYQELYGLHEQFKTKIIVKKGQIICLKSFIKPTQVINGLTGITPIIPIPLNICKKEIQYTHASE